MNKDEKLPIREVSDDEVIRFKGLADGCKTWDAVIERLEEMKQEVQRLEEEGYVIKSSEDDYLFYYEADFCCWCGEPMKEGEEDVIGFDLGLKEFLRKVECFAFDVEFEERFFIGVTVGKNAHPEMVSDVIFACCGEECGKQLGAWCEEGDRLSKIKEAVLEEVRKEK